MRAFLRVPGGYACELESAELRILSRVIADTCELLGHPLGEDDETPASSGEQGADAEANDDAVLASLDWQPAAAETPSDPALARLLPPASTDDEELAGELRRLTEGALRATKVDHLSIVHRRLQESSGVVIVRAGEERAWLSAITDIRLVLAARLGIETDADADRVYEHAGQEELEAPADELDAALTSLYAALTWWQESLLEAMSGRDR